MAAPHFNSLNNLRSDKPIPSQHARTPSTIRRVPPPPYIPYISPTSSSAGSGSTSSPGNSMFRDVDRNKITNRLKAPRRMVSVEDFELVPVSFTPGSLAKSLYDPTGILQTPSFSDHRKARLRTLNVDKSLPPRPALGSMRRKTMLLAAPAPLKFEQQPTRRQLPALDSSSGRSSAATSPLSSPSFRPFKSELAIPTTPNSKQSIFDSLPAFAISASQPSSPFRMTSFLQVVSPLSTSISSVSTDSPAVITVARKESITRTQPQLRIDTSSLTRVSSLNYSIDSADPLADRGRGTPPPSRFSDPTPSSSSLPHSSSTAFTTPQRSESGSHKDGRAQRDVEDIAEGISRAKAELYDAQKCYKTELVGRNQVVSSCVRSRSSSFSDLSASITRSDESAQRLMNAMESINRLQNDLISNLSIQPNFDPPPSHDHFIELEEELNLEEEFLLNQTDPTKLGSPSVHSASDRFFTLPTIPEHSHQTPSRSSSPFPPPRIPLPATPRSISHSSHSSRSSSRFSSSNSTSSSDIHSFKNDRKREWHDVVEEGEEEDGEEEDARSETSSTLEGYLDLVSMVRDDLKPGQRD